MKLARLFVVAVTLFGLVPAHTAVAVTYSKIMIWAPDGAHDRVVVVNAATRNVIGAVKVGVSPMASVFVPTKSAVYVANLASDNVSVINTADGDQWGKVVATIDVGSGPVKIGYSAARNKVYVVNLVSRTVTVIRASDNAVIKTITGFGVGAASVAVDDRIGRVFVGAQRDGTIQVVDTATDAIVSSFDPHVGVQSEVTDVEVVPAQNRLYAVDGSWDNPPPPSFMAFNTAPGQGMAKVASLDLRTSGSDLTVNPAGTRAYVTQSSRQGDFGVNVINLMTNTSITHIPVSNVSDVAVDPNGQVYVSAWESGGMYFVNPVNNTVLDRVPVGGDPYGLSVSYTQSP